MATVDDRIVSISFENTKFEAKVAETMSSLSRLDTAISHAGTQASFSAPMSALDKLKAKLGMTTAGSTFTDMEAAANRVSFSGLTGAIDGIAGHFSALKTAGAVALGNLVAVAAQKGAQLASSLFDPIKQGFQDYETQINAVQTILANTGLKGASGLRQVNSVLQDLQKYANLTVYNFADMAKNIGTFTAAGVQLKPAQESIKGIANLAALSGSNSQQASMAMYQLSQAIAAGKVGLQDWNSVVNAGMGGAVFQKALMRTGEAMGTISKGAVQIDKATGHATINGQSFRESIQAKPGEKSWLTSDVLVKTLGQFTGDATKAQLAAEGFNNAQIKAIQAQARTAVDAATKIKTFTQLTQAVKEEVATAWGNVFKILFGNLGQATTLFSGMHTVIENALTGPINNFAKTLGEWAKLGGRKDLLDGLKQAFKDLKAILDPIKQAFRDIFPKESAQGLVTLTKSFEDLMKRLQPSKQTTDEIKRAFEGFFAVLHIGWTIFKDVIGLFGNLLGAAKPAAGGILELAARFGDWLVSLNNAVSKEGVLKAFFGGLIKYIQPVLDFLNRLADGFKNLFSGDISGGASAVSGAVSGVTKSLSPLQRIADGAQKAWQKFLDILGKIKTAVSPLLGDVANAIGNFGKQLADDIKKADYSNVFAAIQTTLIGGIFLAIKKALGGGSGGLNLSNLGGGLVKNISSVFKGVTENLEQMQKVLKATVLLEIASAIGILAVALLILAGIDPKKMTDALTAVAVGMGELVASMALLNKVGAGTGGLKMTAMAGSLILLATALTILAGAMKIFATMSWGDILKGLAGVAGALTAVSVGVKLMDGPKIIVTAAALLPLAVALNILAVAMKIFATMSWEGIAKGLTSVTVALAGIGLAMTLMPTNLPITGAGLILVASALIILSGAVLAFGRMKIETLAKGIGAIAVSLGLIGAAMNVFPPDTPLIAAGLILVAGAMVVLAGAISLMGHMSIETLAKGLITMGVALGIMAVGLEAMSGTLVGSAALLVAAAAFALLGPAMALIGSLPLLTIVKAIGAMAAVLATLAIVGGLAAVPLAALGAAIVVLGTGFALIGGAVYLFAKGMSELSGNATKGMAALIAAVTALLAVFPHMVIEFIKGLVQILDEVVKLAPHIVEGLVTIAGDLLDGIVKLAPKIATAIGVLVTQIIKVLTDNAPQIIKAGYTLLEDLLKGLADNIPKIIPLVARIITEFLNGISKHIEGIVTAGANLLVHFLNGVAKNLWRVINAAGNIITHIITGIGNVLWKVVNAGGDVIAHLITGIGNNLYKVITAGADMITHVLTGIQNAIPKVRKKAVSVAGTFIDNLVSGIIALVGRVYNGLINLMNGLAAMIRKNNKPFWNAGWNLAWAIIQGAIDGLGSLAGHFLGKVKDIAGQAVHLLTHPWEIFSPSRVTYRLGMNIMLGMAKGLEDNAHVVYRALDNHGKTSLQTVNRAFSKIPATLSTVMDVQPTIKPVLDLSAVKKDAPTLANLMPSPIVTAKLSTEQAKKISGHQATLAEDKAAAAPVGTTVTLNQNNYSPDPLPAIEIYRQTKNQLAQAKSLVGA